MFESYLDTPFGARCFLTLVPRRVLPLLLAGHNAPYDARRFLTDKERKRGYQYVLS